MSGRARGVLGVVCLALAAAACLLPALGAARPTAFGEAYRAALRPVRRAAVARPRLPTGSVDVNTADAKALEALPGVGPVIAEAIVAERDANGPFAYPEDLLTVRGIGAAKLSRFYSQLDFAQADSAAR